MEARLLLEEQKVNEEPKVEEKLAFNISIKKDIICFYCKKKGHKIKNCKKRMSKNHPHHLHFWYLRTAKKTDRGTLTQVQVTICVGTDLNLYVLNQKRWTYILEMEAQ